MRQNASKSQPVLLRCSWKDVLLTQNYIWMRNLILYVIPEYPGNFIRIFKCSQFKRFYVVFGAENSPVNKKIEKLVKFMIWLITLRLKSWRKGKTAAKMPQIIYQNFKYTFRKVSSVIFYSPGRISGPLLTDIQKFLVV